MSRFRLQDDLGRVWDAEDKKWQKVSWGYSTYRTFALAVAAARRTTASRFVTAGGVRAVADTSEWTR